MEFYCTNLLLLYFIVPLGIVILEMATGKVMSTTLPTKQDYKHETKEVKEVLEYIFELKHSVTEVSVGIKLFQQNMSNS